MLAIGENQKRQFLAALTASANEVFPFLCRMLEQNFLAANESRGKGGTQGTHAHTAGRLEHAPVCGRGGVR